MHVPRYVVALAIVPLAACTTTGKKNLIEAAIRDDGRRYETFEATLRVLDEHPDYVDQFFGMAQRHPRTLDRFIADATAELDERRLARLTADLLARHPDSLYRILVETLDASNGDGVARGAIARAIGDRPREAVAAIASRPRVVADVTGQMLARVSADEAARAAFLQALGAGRARMARILAGNPAALRAMVGSLLGIAERDPGVARLIMAQTVGALRRPAFARATAGELAAHPAALEAMLAETVRAVSARPHARRALAAAIQRSGPTVARILAERPQAVSAMMSATLDAIADRPAAKEELLRVMRERHADLTALLLSDPRTAATFVSELAGRGARFSLLADRLRELLGIGGARASSPP